MPACSPRRGLSLKTHTDTWISEQNSLLMLWKKTCPRQLSGRWQKCSSGGLAPSELRCSSGGLTPSELRCSSGGLGFGSCGAPAAAWVSGAACSSGGLAFGSCGAPGWPGFRELRCSSGGLGFGSCGAPAEAWLSGAAVLQRRSRGGPCGGVPAFRQRWRRPGSPQRRGRIRRGEKTKTLRLLPSTTVRRCFGELTVVDVNFVFIVWYCYFYICMTAGTKFCSDLFRGLNDNKGIQFKSRLTQMYIPTVRDVIKHRDCAEEIY